MHYSAFQPQKLGGRRVGGFLGEWLLGMGDPGGVIGVIRSSEGRRSGNECASLAVCGL